MLAFARQNVTCTDSHRGRWATVALTIPDHTEAEQNRNIPQSNKCIQIIQAIKIFIHLFHTYTKVKYMGNNNDWRSAFLKSKVTGEQTNSLVSKSGKRHPRKHAWVLRHRNVVHSNRVKKTLAVSVQKEIQRVACNMSKCQLIIGSAITKTTTHSKLRETFKIMDWTALFTAEYKKKIETCRVQQMFVPVDHYISNWQKKEQTHPKDVTRSK